MKPALTVLALSALLAAASPAAPQSSPQPPAPAQSAPPAPAATPAAQKPPARPLILRLDEIDGPRMSVGQSASEKPPENELPGLGGRPSKNWERSTDQAIPRDSEKAVGY